GSFTIGGLTPGDYRLLVRGVPMLGSSEPVTASAAVTVGGDDVAGVRLVAGKPSVAAGTVVVSDARAAQSLRPSTLRVIAIPDDEMIGAFGDGDGRPSVGDDWSFQVTLPGGRARLALFGTP